MLLMYEIEVELEQIEKFKLFLLSIRHRFSQFIDISRKHIIHIP